MQKSLLSLLPAILLWIVFTIVIFQIPYPETLTQANTIQIISFFTPLYLALVFTLNIFWKNVSISASLSLGITFLLILKALDSLNLVTGILILISIFLLVSYFKKDHSSSNKSSGLTNGLKIPKLSKLKRRRS